MASKCDAMAEALMEIAGMYDSLFMQAKARETLHKLGILDVYRSKPSVKER